MSTDSRRSSTNTAGGNALDKQKDEKPSTIPDSHSLEKGGNGGVAVEEVSKDAASVKDEPPPPHSPPQRSKGRLVLIMVALALAAFLSSLDSTIVTTALPTITEAFRSEVAYTWVGSSYLLASASTMIIWGKLADIFGRKPILLIANFIFFVGSLISALSINVTMLLFGRAIQGVGSSGVMVAVNVCIGDLFSPRVRSAFYGVIGCVWAVAICAGPLAGGAFTEKVSWRWCFYINLPLDGLAFVLVLLFLDVKNPKTPFVEGIKMIDWLGGTLAIGGTLMFLFGLSFGSVRDPWNSAVVICQIVFGIVAWIFFILYETYGAKYPLLPVHLFTNRAQVALLGLCFIQSFVFLSAIYYLPLYFQAVLGATPILSGVYLIPLAVAMSVTSIGAGQLLRKIGRYRLIMWIGFALMTLGVGLFVDLAPSSPWSLIIIAQILLGAGSGPNLQVPMIVLQSVTPQRYIAGVTSCFTFIRILAGAIAIVIDQVVFQNRTTRSLARLQQVVYDPDLAQQLASGAAGANTAQIADLPLPEREVVHEILAQSLKYVWIMCTVICATSLLVMVLVPGDKLSSEHKETEVGVQAEREKRGERLAMGREGKLEGEAGGGGGGGE